MKTIIVTQDVYNQLLAKKQKIEWEEKKSCSFGKTIQYLLEVSSDEH